MDTREAYDLIAEDWHTDHQDDSWWIDGTEKFISMLPPGGSVLDAGCGAGSKSAHLARKGLNVFGIDFSATMIGIAAREVAEARFAVLDMHDLGRLEETFDGIFFQASLLHIPKKDVVGILRDAKRKLNADGIMYIAVKEPRAGQAEEAVIREDDYGYPYERFFSYFTVEELKGFLKEVGMETVYESVTPSGNTRWIQVIGK